MSLYTVKMLFKCIYFTSVTVQVCYLTLAVLYSSATSMWTFLKIHLAKILIVKQTHEESSPQLAEQYGTSFLSNTVEN